ncbi:hypothetical protein M9H77_34301 [Catharanthus roseus]|uniref:Uncharacterized protein n=1 Tax=Catharanthus roseus TaxID=4058 RepID=A0ACB9ZN99_CATRO|nr:hypothetical protein M9H77_34301 [Catharanthus roseus]
MYKVIEENLVEIQCIIINGDMVTFLILLELMCIIFIVPGNDARIGGNYVNMDERFNKRKGDYEGYYDSYNYGGYNYRRSSQTLGTTSRPLSYINLKLPLLCGTLGPYDYEAWEQKVELLFYSYCVRKEEKFQLWDSKCENIKGMGAQPLKTWSLMKKSLRNRFGVGNHEGKRKGQPKVRFMESSMVKESPKVIELSQAKIEESLKIHVVEDEKSIEIKEKERVENKERLVERSCIFDSISIFSKESEHVECSKEKKSELEKRERVKENECFIEK